MPRKKHLDNGDVAPDGQKTSPPAAINSQNLRDRDGMTVAPRDSLEAVSKRLGARYWATNKRFDWALDSSQHHYEFTRFYFEQNVIVDVWPRSNNGTRKEAEKKKECVDAENARRLKAGKKPLGYVSFVRGAIVPDAVFDDALDGRTMSLIERATEGVLAT